MLVTRQYEAERNHWSFSKYDPSPRKAESPRMSNHFTTPLSTQPEWQGQYSYLPHGEDNTFASSHNNEGAEVSETSHRRSEPASALTVHTKDTVGRQSPRMESRQRTSYPSPASDHPESIEDLKTKPSRLSQEGANTQMAEGRHMEASNAIDTTPSTRSEHGDVEMSPKEDDDEDLVDDDMIEAEDGSSRPQTAAERTAARRKMKRFRLTHQQTRFLMSEFAKQPHPDAAHRERLSKEIPGLSPRQVQVWFQNRRAKIKRLNADDRDRMIKMRAVPDDFDNIQALHSPYGAVHGIGAPMASPMEFGTQTYAEHMIRPLVIDVRRHDGNDMSSSGIAHGYSYSPASALSNPEVMSPLSTASSDRFSYGSQLSTPLSAGPRISHPFGRQNGIDASMHLNRQGIRSLQPLHLRDTMSRPRSESLQSPLRSGMSWKGDTIDYSYPGTNTSPSLSERSPPSYHPSPMGPTSSGGLGYGSSPYSATSSFSSLQNRSRVQAASATLPLNLDLRNQFRSATSALHSPSPSGPPRGPTSSSQHSSPSIYTTSYPSAPLTAPMDYSANRHSSVRSVPDYSAAQSSAPISAPSDFSQALHASMSTSSSRTPMRDSFSGSFRERAASRDSATA